MGRKIDRKEYQAVDGSTRKSENRVYQCEKRRPVNKSGASHSRVNADALDAALLHALKGHGFVSSVPARVSDRERLRPGNSRISCRRASG